MTAIIPAEHFEDKVNEVIQDLEGQDEWFYHEASLRTIYWWVGRLKTIQVAVAEIRNKGDRRQFIQAVSAGYKKMPERRIYEGLAVMKKYAKQGDSLKETCERIFQSVGGWSRALPSKKQETAEVEAAQITCTGKCALHCKHE